MTLLSIVIPLIIVGFALWLINRYIPMQPNIKAILNGVVIVFVAIWLLQVSGIWASIRNYRL